jgi:hypothetical protein
VEGFQGRLGDHGQQERGEQAAELLVLGHADPARAGGLDGEAVLAVEQAGHQEPAEPAEGAAWVGVQHLGAQDRRPATGEVHVQLEAGAGNGLAAGLDDERVPLRVGGEVGEDLPHAFRRRLDLDLGLQLLGHPCLLCERLTLLATVGEHC